jgi:hypothetical protein
MEHMKTLTAIACTLCVCACAFAATRQLTGLESVTDSEDDSNGGFWNTSGRGGFSVGEGGAALGAAVSTASESSGFDITDALDTRAFTWEESPIVPIRTDRVAFFLIVR